MRSGRLVALFLKQRSVPGSIVAILAMIAAMVWLTEWIESGGQTRMAVTMIVGPAVIASVVSIAMWSPSSDLEASSSFPLRWSRLLHFATIGGFGLIGTCVVVASWSERIGGVDQSGMWIRNVAAMTGVALILARFVNPRHSWFAPGAVALIGTMTMLRRTDDPQTGVNEIFSNPTWNIVGLADSSVVAMLVTVILIIVGIGLMAQFGPRAQDAMEL